MNIPDNLKYASSHEWVRVDDEGVATIGISDFAQQQMNDVVFVDLPEVGRQVTAKEDVAVVESIKSASDIYSPVSGEVIEVNGDLADNPASVNESPYDSGWMLKVKMSDPSELDALLDAAGYLTSIG